MSTDKSNQPVELREYLDEAERLVADWYSREGLESSHERALRTIATLYCLQTVIQQKVTFDQLSEIGLIYMIAAFQMGRAAQGTNDDGK